MIPNYVIDDALLVKIERFFTGNGDEDKNAGLRQDRNLRAKTYISPSTLYSYKYKLHKKVPQKRVFFAQFLIAFLFPAKQLGLSFLSLYQQQKTMHKTKQLPPYPVAPSQAVTEDYFGTSITDDFRNMENLKDPLVKKWFQEQADYSNNILPNISGREALIRKMESYNERTSFRIFQIHITEDNQYFFLKQGGNENTPALYYRKKFESADELFFASSDFKKDSDKKYVIKYIKPSWDGAYILIALNHSGQDAAEMIVIDKASRKAMPFVIDHCDAAPGFGVSWLRDNSGFIYTHYPNIDPDSEQYGKDVKSVLYKIADDPTNFKTIFSQSGLPNLDANEEGRLQVRLKSKTDKYLFGLAFSATAYHHIFYAPVSDLDKTAVNWKLLFTPADKVEKVIFDNDRVIYTSARNASNFQLLNTSIENADLENPTILAEAKEDEVLGQIELTSEALYYTSSKNGVEAKLYKIQNGKTSSIPLPESTGQVFISSKGKDHPELWVRPTGWLNGASRYRYQNEQLIEAPLRPKVHFPEFDNFVVKELLVSSHDGALVPFSIIHKKGIELNGQQPTLIRAYGCYGMSLKPVFLPDFLTWVEEGGIYCTSHVRGGGEKGDAWYQAGKKANKPNGWKDLIACAEYLINEGYTASDKTAIWGGSAGGILIGRAMTERPDLFAAVIGDVPSMNALRIEFTTHGTGSVDEIGSYKDPEGCKGLIEMDAYLHLEKGVKYPATLLTTGMHDHRVSAWVPGKFIAQIQRFSTSDKPMLLKVHYGAGHGGDGTHSNRLERLADVFCFAFWQLEHSGFEWKAGEN